MVRRLSLLLLSFVLVISLAPAVAFGATRQLGTTSAVSPLTASLVTSYCASPEELAVLNLINQYRAQNGLPGLSLSLSLSKAAEYHSLDMAQNGYFSHTLADGTTWSQNIVNHGYNYGTWKGENIAAGYSTADGAFNGWRNSPGHNANMLQPNFVAIGIGFVVQPGSPYTYYWTTTFGGVADGGAVGCDGSVPSTGGGASSGAGVERAPGASRDSSGSGSSSGAAPSSNTSRGSRPPRGGDAASPAPTPGSSQGGSSSRPPRTR